MNLDLSQYSRQKKKELVETKETKYFQSQRRVTKASRKRAAPERSEAWSLTVHRQNARLSGPMARLVICT
ncbi:hypothetical protein FACS18948_4220 [Clostridia bacterium]|nr:hypothetical protein FACS18948_4220 [Clostridia bacterium]